MDSPTTGVTSAGAMLPFVGIFWPLATTNNRALCNTLYIFGIFGNKKDDDGNVNEHTHTHTPRLTALCNADENDKNWLIYSLGLGYVLMYAVFMYCSVQALWSPCWVCPTGLMAYRRQWNTVFSSAVILNLMVRLCSAFCYFLRVDVQRAIIALTLLVGCQEEHQACKNWVMRCWRGYLSGVRCRLFAYGPAECTASPNSIISCLIKSRLVLPFWYRLTRVILEKRPLNGCSSSKC